MITALVGLLFPVLAFAYLIMPRSGIGRIMRQPFIKFICHSVSYIFFLSMFLDFYNAINFVFFIFSFTICCFITD
jgi:hypothetical protein